MKDCNPLPNRLFHKSKEEKNLAKHPLKWRTTHLEGRRRYMLKRSISLLLFVSFLLAFDIFMKLHFHYSKDIFDAFRDLYNEGNLLAYSGFIIFSVLWSLHIWNKNEKQYADYVDNLKK